MIVLDVNLLLYAYDSESLRHDAARVWIDRVFSGSELVGIPWQTISAFLRISTNPRLTAGRFPMERAVGIVADWMSMKQIRLLVPTERHWGIFQRMLDEGDVTGPLATNAELAALTIEFAGILHTADRDFARFPGLRWVNPFSS